MAVIDPLASHLLVEVVLQLLMLVMMLLVEMLASIRELASAHVSVLHLMVIDVILLDVHLVLVDIIELLVIDRNGLSSALLGSLGCSERTSSPWGSDDSWSTTKPILLCRWSLTYMCCLILIGFILDVVAEIISWHTMDLLSSELPFFVLSLAVAFLLISTTAHAA